MKALLIRHHENNTDIWPNSWAGTLGEAKRVVRETVPKHLREDILVEELVVQSDKVGFMAALNGDPITDGKPLRTWGVTPRGSLKEEENVR